MPDHDGVDAAKEMVAVKLHAYGEKRNILPRECDKGALCIFLHLSLIKRSVKSVERCRESDFRVGI